MESYVHQIYEFWPENLHWLIVPWGWLCIWVGSVFIALIGTGIVRNLALGKPMIDRATGQPASKKLVVYLSVTFLSAGAILLWVGVEIVR